MCLACRPVEERFRRRALSGKVCAACEIEKPRDQYSNTQWEKGTASKCIACCSTPQVNNAKEWVRSCMAQLQARCAIFCREMPGMRMFLPVALSNQNSPISHICGSIHIPCIYMKKNPASIHYYMFWFGAGLPFDIAR